MFVSLARPAAKQNAGEAQGPPPHISTNGWHLWSHARILLEQNENIRFIRAVEFDESDWEAARAVDT
jgi:hypothetical protein